MFLYVNSDRVFRCTDVRLSSVIKLLLLKLIVLNISLQYLLTLPYLTFGVGRLLYLPSAETVSVRPNAQPRCNQKVTVIGCEAEQITSTWDW